MSQHTAAAAMDCEFSIDTSIRDKMLQKLPQELYDLIEHYFYELTFLPGYIYPLGRPRSHLDWTEIKTLACEGRVEARPSLLCLNKDIYAQYRKRVYAENTIVWGSGREPQFNMTSSFSGNPIKTNLEIAFGPEDRDCKMVKRWREIEPTLHQVMNTRLTESQLKLLAVEELLLAWRSKLAFCGLLTWELDDLTLDFQRCFGANGQWLGCHIMKQLDTTCAYTPNRITVLAPDAEKKKEIWNIIRKFHWYLVE
ncbi:MAG: hypothetical protein LQ337_003497 [Flavoplaca oasis]|nr:MAG: hypothetical protein LQ337_003497 [Flavoplaca oasis]